MLCECLGQDFNMNRTPFKPSLSALQCVKCIITDVRDRLAAIWKIEF